MSNPTIFDLDHLRKFLSEATRNFRNGPKTDIFQNHDGSTEIIYIDGDWKAVSHCGSNKLDSTLAVYFGETMIFLMCCAHNYIDFNYRNDVFNCLHGALLEPNPNFPIRGSNDREHTELHSACYHNRSRGFTTEDLSEFSGSESITVPGNDGHLICVYAAQYSGGLIPHTTTLHGNDGRLTCVHTASYNGELARHTS